MSSSFMGLLALSIGWCVANYLASLFWLGGVSLALRRRLRHPAFWAKGLLGCVGLGVGLAFFFDANSDTTVLIRWGRFLASILHLQLAAAFFVLAFSFLLTVFPKAGAVALAAFREGVRQPMFWLLGGAFLSLMLISPFIPYFTFGEDLKMVQELCYAFTMMAPAIFGVVAASMSVSEEIEGRTAVTLMSKPVSRRQFLLGKFAGLLLAALFMTVLLGWFLVWVILFKQFYDPPIEQQIPDPAWVTNLSESIWGLTSAGDLFKGMLFWVDQAASALPGLVTGFCQVMVLLAIAVALATRLPMLVNLAVCLVVYFLGHLTPIMTEVASRGYALVYFVAQLFDTLLPGLDLFDVGSAVVREVPLPPAQYALYTFNVAFYAVTYTAIALLFGLILFEDRDLA